MGAEQSDNVFIGTCSWMDRSLIECWRFYPGWANSPEARLRFYSSQFPIVEVDTTYYSLPAVRLSTPGLKES
ncbi:MAG: DUF72 domain-containing protein [Candidatus Binatia bacterium]